MTMAITTEGEYKDILPRGYKFSFSGGTIFAGDGAPEKYKLPLVKD
jgi:hypothetical protein